MASNANSIVPATTNLTVGTTAASLNTSALQVAKFTLTNTGANPIYIGDSNVSSSRYTAKITTGNNFSFGETKFFQNQSQAFDLASFYARATAASQTLTITTYLKGPAGGAF